MPEFSFFLAKAAHSPLSESEMADCMTGIMAGRVADADIAVFLSTLHERGESAGEITGAARVMRGLASTIDAPPGAIDCCGTGGDGLKTLNISTAVALVCAACGVSVAKHGNRAASSASGAADVLEQCGVDLNLSRDQLESALRDLNFCFLMAPNHHAAMKHVSMVRKSLPHRTIFNLLGPLANPAGTKKQLIGVFGAQWLVPLAESLRALGSDRALIVHGADGLDEITLSGPTYAAHLHNDIVTNKIFLPADFGLPETPVAAICGLDAKHNAAALLDLLSGARNAYRSYVLANAAAVLMLHDDRPLLEGVRTAAQAIDEGKALSVLTSYKAIRA